jgi:hypothetical protein
MPLNSSDAGSSSVNTGNISSSSSVNTGNISSSSVSSSSAGTTGSTCTSVRSAGDCDEHVVETALKRNRPPRLFDNTGSQGSRSSSRDSSCSVAWKELLQQRLEQLAPACTNTTLPKLQEYKQLSFEQLVGSWKRHLCNAAQVLLALETADTAQAAAAAHASLQEWDDGFSGLCVIILNPSLMVKLTLLDMEANVEVNPYAQEQHWLEVLHGLQLTEEQLQLFMAVFELVARDLVAISRQRKALLTQVYSAAAGTGEATGVPAGTTPCAMQHTMPPELPKMPPSVAAPASLSAAAAAAAAAADAGSGSAEPSADLQRLLSQVQMTLKQEFLVIVTLNGALIDRVLSSKQVREGRMQQRMPSREFMTTATAGCAVPPSPSSPCSGNKWDSSNSSVFTCLYSVHSRAVFTLQLCVEAVHCMPVAKQKHDHQPVAHDHCVVTDWSAGQQEPEPARCDGVAAVTELWQCSCQAGRHEVDLTV